MNMRIDTAGKNSPPGQIRLVIECFRQRVTDPCDLSVFDGYIAVKTALVSRDQSVPEYDPSS